MEYKIDIITTAYDAALKKIFPNISDETLMEYRNVFIDEIHKLKK